MSFEAEQALLGGILLDNRQFFMAPVELRDFGDERHRKIYGAIAELLKESKPVDVVAVSEALSPDVLAYLAQIVDNTPTAENAPHYARLVREAAERKRLITELRRTVIDLEAKAPLEDVRERLMEALNDGCTHHRAKPFREVVAELAAHINEMQEAKEGGGVRTGLPSFDFDTGGLHGERMVTLGARTGVGKTMFALQIVANGAKEGKGVLVVSLETGAWEIAARLFARVFNCEYSALLHGRNDAVEKFQGTDLKQFKGWPIWIDDRSRTLTDIRARLYEAKYRFNIALGIIDHIQLVQTRGRNRFEELSEISRTVKAIAMNLKTPILVLSQLNREHVKEKRDPRGSDLRESGSIEQDSDAVLLLHRWQEEVEGFKPEWQYKLIIDKNRGGTAGCAIPLMVDPTRGLIDELLDEYE